MKTDEVWKDIEGYEGKYQISNKGNVKSLNYNNTKQEKILKPKTNRYGYYEVKLSKNNKTKNFLVSTLVAKHFLQQTRPDTKAMHIRDVTDNNVENLKYAYRSEFLFATYKKGRRKGNPSRYTISYKGIKAKNLSEIAMKNNIDPKILFKRINRGWTLEEAIEIPIKRKEHTLKKALYKYDGKLLSVRQIAEKYNISERCIYKRLNRGWSIEETIEIPIANMKNKGVKNEN